MFLCGEEKIEAKRNEVASPLVPSLLNPFGESEIWCLVSELNFFLPQILSTFSCFAFFISALFPHFQERSILTLF